MELRDRLRIALREGSEPAATAVRPMAAAGQPSVPARRPSLDLPVRRVETGRGAVYLAEQWWPLDHRHGRLSLRNALALDGAAASRLAQNRGAVDVSRAAFVDVETTGLAGGTGTYVFLVGLGTFEPACPADGPAGPADGDGSFRLRQFFLADLRGETAMLAAVYEVLAGHRAVVSFNGRAFDLPLLETRLTLNRLSHPDPRVPHLDLLLPARRLFRRRLPSCRLAYLEEALLGVRREDDVPGWAIPALYFDYARSGNAGPLRAVFHHNALDILSLVTLLSHLGRLVNGERLSDPGDCFALARWDDSEGRHWDASRLYAAALAGGVAGHDRALAVRRLGRLYKRLGRCEDAFDVWRRAADAGTPGQRLEALVELAKLEEHRRRDYAAAEALTRRAISFLEVVGLQAGGYRAGPGLRREDLEHRLSRLRRRLGAARPPGASASRPTRRA